MNCRMYLDNEEIGVDDEQERHEVNEDGVDQDVAAAEPVLCQVVGSACSHVSFRHVTIKMMNGKNKVREPRRC